MFHMHPDFSGLRNAVVFHMHPDFSRHMVLKPANKTVLNLFDSYSYLHIEKNKWLKI